MQDIFDLISQFGGLLLQNDIPLTLKLAVAALLCVSAVRRIFAGKPWAESGLGGLALAWGTASLLTLVTAAVGGAALSWSLAGTAALAALQAVGGYEALKRALLPALSALEAWLPGWASWLPKLLSSVLGAAVIKKAEAAGDKAVADRPSGGAASVVGEPTGPDA